MENSESHKQSPEIMGRVYLAETDAGKQVRIQVSKVASEQPTGWNVWGYRVNTRTRSAAGSSYPRRYFISR